MKLIFAIVQNDDSKRLIRELVKHHISVTRISSTGGFLHGGNSTLMIGVEKEKLEANEKKAVSLNERIAELKQSL